MRAALVVLAVVLGACGSGDDSAVRSVTAETTTTSICAHIPREQGGCGLTFEEQRRLNLRYADRVDFSGDVDEAQVIADEVRSVLEPLAVARPSPTAEEMRRALQAWEPEVQVADNAVRTAGTAFGIAITGGCVFGSINAGELEVSIGGYVNDGGCLAVYGH